MKRSWPIAFDKLPASVQSLSLSDSVESQDSNEPTETNENEEEQGKQSVDVEVDGEETELALETTESPPSLFSATPPIEANLQWEMDQTQSGDTGDSQNTVGWDIGGSPVHAAEPASMDMDRASMGMEQPGADAAAGPHHCLQMRMVPISILVNQTAPTIKTKQLKRILKAMKVQKFYHTCLPPLDLGICFAILVSG